MRWSTMMRKKKKKREREAGGNARFKEMLLSKRALLQTVTLNSMTRILTQGGLC